ncbi:MAG: MFS transporter, partial [Rhizobiales bacterium]|nr:MFS transporter [Hyphomicrobiales bacterium]
MFSAVKYFNKTVWFILFATFLSRFTFLMVWPFLALILHNKFGMNEFEIGSFLALAVSIGVFTSFFTGNLSDRVGRRKIIILGLILTTIALFLLGNSDELLVILAATTLQSIARGMVEDPSRALMTDMIKTREAKDLSLQLRYFMINVGAAFGPLFGVYIGIGGKQTSFYFAAAIYLLYLLVALITFNIEKPLTKTKAGQDQSFKQLFKLLKADHAFLILVFAIFLSNLAYAQVDAGLIQYLRVDKFEDIAILYASLLSVNGMTIIIFQFPILKLLENVNPMRKSLYGVVLFIFGFMAFAASSNDIRWMLFVAMFILSMGEAILFPTINILIDRMAP